MGGKSWPIDTMPDMNTDCMQRLKHAQGRGKNVVAQRVKLYSSVNFFLIRSRSESVASQRSRLKYSVTAQLGDDAWH